ncbi:MULTISPECIES: cytidylate kinase-like family protein [unclassified Clostridium]|jgi:cytidylate kinase|uniref:cytidylate kinase-like family protein n=1 Tax=unclassified Clostridium TaxID=2614128 RepID=UPI000E510C16|nr:MULTISPECIES: cytidylate kinase-like family protein [unclassified Clostridium]RHP94656.1 cytidylate kinase-like family protein [Clostridium sp. AM54-37XD]RHP96202.1 cytidylate kinase-like family protein [Clostridium sp. AM54-14XD]
MIVTLGRQCGCAGDEIGRKLSELLGIPFYTKPELIALAKEKKIYEKYPMYFGEQPVNAMISSVADDFCSNQYDTPKKALAALFGKESFIIIGRASNYAYREDQNAIRVFLCGDKRLRAQHIAEKHKISDRKAMALVEKTDEKRRGYHRYYTGEEWGYAENYDLCMDAVRLGVDKTAEMIADYVKQVGGK